ncbi:MAG: phosphatidylserine decarboxylase [Gemmatimonadota bacterium]|jgi:phosphatidylserine decarboxylase
MFRLAPEGWPFVLAGLALTGLTGILGLISGPDQPFVHFVSLGAAGTVGLLTVFTLYFFRNPKRRRRDGDALVLAPGDGRIVEIATVEEPAFFPEPATRISIFLSIFDVHVQRAPVTGRVALKNYRPGGFAVAWKSKASEDNEQATLGIISGQHRVMVRQIAGLIARRIVTDPEEGDLIPQGTRIGLIRFGSRVDLLIPENWELTCRVGDRAKGGVSALARIPDSPGGRRP